LKWMGIRLMLLLRMLFQYCFSAGPV